MVFLGTLVLIASGLLTMLSLFYILLTTPRRQEVWIHLISPRFILVYLIKNVMKILLDEAFRVRGARYKKNDDKSEIKSMLVGMIEYLVDNIYVSVGSTVFRQCVGIPMGTDCAPLLANLYILNTHI